MSSFVNEPAAREEPLLAEEVTYTAISSSEKESVASSSSSSVAQDEDKTCWKRVRYQGMDDDIGNHQRPWRLKYVEGKGYIALANRSFKMGEWICTEFPCVWIHGHHPFNEQQIADIAMKVSALNDEDRAAFYDMANVFSEDEFPAAVGIFMTNSFDMTDTPFAEQDENGEEIGCCAMYLALARLNHSCIPNVQQSHIPDTTEEVVYASRDIAKDDEINDCYIDLRQDRQKRRHELLKHYRFHCKCPACEYDKSFVYPSIKIPSFTFNKDGAIDSQAAFEASVKWIDTHRNMANTFTDYVIQLIENDQLDKALKLTNNICQLWEMPINKLWSIRYLPELYLNLAQIHSGFMFMYQFDRKKKKQAEQHRDEVIEYTEAAYNLNMCLQGSKAPDTVRTKQMVEDNWELESMQF